MPSRRADRQEKPQDAARSGGVNKKHEALILIEALKKRPDHAPVLLRLAQMAEDAGNQPQAIRYLQDILHSEPNNTDAQLELGKALFQAGDVQGSITQTKEILDRQSDQPDALYNLGAIYANLNDRKLALQYWNRLIASNPQSASAERARQLMTRIAGADNSIAENRSSYQSAADEHR